MEEEEEEEQCFVLKDSFLTLRHPGARPAVSDEDSVSTVRLKDAFFSSD